MHHYLEKTAGLGDSQERQNLVAEVEGVITHPALCTLFDGTDARTVLAEVPVAAMMSTGPIVRQIDRLVVEEESVRIIDFKTDRDIPGDEAGVPVGYLQQMAAYRAIIARIWPDKKIVCTLFWTSDPQAMTLTDPLLDRHAP